MNNLLNKNVKIGVKSAEKNDLKHSIECFTLAIEKAPYWASAYNNRAQALRLTGDIDGNIFSVSIIIICHSISFNCFYT